MTVTTAATRILEEVLHWRIALDISLIAAGFFLLYHTLRAAGTWKIVLGVVLAVAVYATSSLLDLKGLEWIFSNLSGVALIGLIIVFQPEIRRVLERAASVPGAEPGTLREDVSSLLAEAAWTLALRRQGALLVIPGRESVRPWVSGGVALDATPSLPLLLSIFDPHSPGHDGAVVAEQGRLSAFAVRLPLSKTGSLPPEFGTRHHAALGLSENTDALVIAVSEERGTVSLFARGRMTRAATSEEVVSAIQSHRREAGLHELTSQYRTRRRALLWEGALSLAAAVLFWSTVVRPQAEVLETVLTVPIEYTDMPADVALVGEKPSRMRIHVSGPASELERISGTELPVRIDLSRAGPGRQRVLVTAENLRLPKGVRLLDTVPPALELFLKGIERHEAVIRPHLVGHLRKGLYLASVEVDPKTVLSLAPAGEKRERIVNTEPIELGSIRESLSVFAKVVAPPGLQPAAGEWPTVEVRITVTRKPPKGAGAGG